MKYIFVAGAPGSKWSSVVKNIYYSESIDRSDSRTDREWFHSATGLTTPMHLGAYWDPGMEFDIPENCFSLDKTQAEQIFDRPFSGNGTRIIKSHVFGLKENIEWIRHTWPDAPIVLVYRPSDACLGWWYRCGGWDIQYPNYKIYYKDTQNLLLQIDRQNAGIAWAMSKYPRRTPQNNQQLAKILNIACPAAEWQHCYTEHDVQVEVI
jgi:hypothetical protein